MKIVQVQTQAEAAGAQRVSDMLGEGLRARGHQCRTVFMYRKTDVYDRDPNADFVLGERPAGLKDQVRAVYGLIGYMRRERPDAVICFQHYGNIFGTLAARLAGAPRIVANQSLPPAKSGVMGLLSQIDRIMGTLGAYHLNVVNTAWTEAQFDDFPSAYRRRLRRVDHGIVLPPRGYDKRAARAVFGLPLDACIAINSARQTTVKNQIALVGALCRIPDLHVALAGMGPEQPGIIAFAHDNGVADRLHILGEVPPERIYEFLATGDIYVFPSRMESFGLSVAEAAIAGLPIVASGLDVLREVLSTTTGEPAAVFTETTDMEGVAAAIVRLRDDPALATRIALAGRRLAEKYSPQAMADGYAGLVAAPANAVPAEA